MIDKVEIWEKWEDGRKKAISLDRGETWEEIPNPFEQEQELDR